jgi:hypothetical protein
VELPVSQAAKQWGLTRQTLHRAIREGKLSASQGSQGIRTVDMAEMIRVYGEPRKPVPVTLQDEGDGVLQPVSTGDKDALIVTLREQLERANTEKDRLMGIIEQQQGVDPTVVSPGAIWKAA